MKAVHLSPSSISSWARLGAATADSAAAAAAAEDGHDRVSAKVGEACLKAAEKLGMFELLGVARDAGIGGGGNNAEEPPAKDLATALSGIAKTVLCSGGGGKGTAGTRNRAVRATSRAVHLYPGEPSAWRYLATAMVSECRAVHKRDCSVYSGRILFVLLLTTNSVVGRLVVNASAGLEGSRRPFDLKAWKMWTKIC